MDVRFPSVSLRVRMLEYGVVLVTYGLPVALLFTSELSSVAADLGVVAAGTASVISLLLLQVRIGLHHVERSDATSVALLIAGISVWAISVLFAAFDRSIISLSLTAVSAGLLLFALGRIAKSIVDVKAS